MGQLGIPIVPHKLRVSKPRVLFDDGMYIVALVCPVLTIPQFLIVWHDRRTDGLSLITWAAYTIVSGCWLIYGLVRRQKPVFISSLCTFIIDFGVVLGIALFR